MSNQIVTISNVHTVEYQVLMQLLHDVYAKDLPQVDTNIPTDMQELEHLMVFFANQYAYIIELWAKMVHEVRLLKRNAGAKEAIDEAMDKRDYLEKIMSAVKLKYYATSRLLKYHADENM